MPYKISSLLLALALCGPAFTAITALTSCAARSPARTLAENISLGEFHGPGGPELKEALSRISSRAAKAAKAPKAFKAPQSQGGLSLSGRCYFDYREEPQSETVIIREEGEMVSRSQTDELTGQTWEIRAPEITESPRRYEFTRIQGTMGVNWALRAPDGTVLRQGALEDNLERSYGGYLAQEGAAPKTAPGREAALRDLSQALSLQLAQELGPSFGPGDLEHTGDALSREALALCRLGDWDQAAALWTELTRQNPEYAPAHYNLGIWHERSARLQEALRSYRQAYLAKPEGRYRLALTRLTDSLRRMSALGQNY
jgi:tetratricopeptide (TPR) repeat protein